MTEVPIFTDRFNPNPEIEKKRSFSELWTNHSKVMVADYIFLTSGKYPSEITEQQKQDFLYEVHNFLCDQLSNHEDFKSWHFQWSMDFIAVPANSHNDHIHPRRVHVTIPRCEQYPDGLSTTINPRNNISSGDIVLDKFNTILTKVITQGHSNNKAATILHNYNVGFYHDDALDFAHALGFHNGSTSRVGELTFNLYDRLPRSLRK